MLGGWLDRPFTIGHAVMDMSGSRVGCFDSHKDSQGTDSNPRLSLDLCHVGVKKSMVRRPNTLRNPAPSTAYTRVSEDIAMVRWKEQERLGCLSSKKLEIQEDPPLVALHTNVFGSLYY